MIPTPHCRWSALGGRHRHQPLGGPSHRLAPGQRLVTLQSPSFVSLQRDYLHAAAQDVLATQQLRRNTELFEGKAVPQRVVEASQNRGSAGRHCARRRRRQMLRLSGLRMKLLSAGESAWEVPYSAVVRRGEAAAIFVAIEGGFRLIPVTLLAEDQDHVVVAGKVTDENEVAVGGLSALRGILLRLGAGN